MRGSDARVHSFCKQQLCTYTSLLYKRYCHPPFPSDQDGTWRPRPTMSVRHVSNLWTSATQDWLQSSHQLSNYTRQILKTQLQLKDTTPVSPTNTQNASKQHQTSRPSSRHRYRRITTTATLYATYFPFFQQCQLLYPIAQPENLFDSQDLNHKHLTNPEKPG